MIINKFFLLSLAALCVLFYFALNKHFNKGRAEDLGANEKITNQTAEDFLAIMSDMDKALLSNVSYEHLLRSIFPRLFTLFPCSFIAITQLNAEKKEDFNTNVFYHTKPIERCVIDLNKSIKRELDHNANGIFLENDDQHTWLQPLLGEGTECVLVLPSYVEANLSSVFYLGFTDKKKCTDLVKQQGRDFAGRMSVILTSIAHAKRLFDKKHFDLVTFLPNRAYSGDLLSLEISRANRYQSRIALLYLQLEGLKKVNEMAGYATSDRILKEVANRLKSCLRDTDLIAHFGSNEFAVILPEVASDIGISKVAEKLIIKLSELYTQDNNPFYLHCRIGISTFPNDSQTVDSLFSKADFAMTMSKFGEFTFHTERINTTTNNQLMLERDLHKALERGELFVLYQPQIDLRKEKIVGLEALVRWQHPTKGIVSPLEFLAIAEETDLINKVGTYVRNAAFEQFKVWQSQGVAPNRLALNISSKEIMHDSFVRDFETQLQNFELNPSSIEIEITESLLVDMTGHVKDSLDRLRGLGVAVAIDDFGTGYSSLSYIAQLPFDVLKLDRTFVSEVGKSIDKVEIVSLIIDMAHNLKKSVCAEGVENKEQLDFLKDRGCETVQGYLLSRPISATDFELFSSNWNAQMLDTTREVKAVKEIEI